MEKGNTETLAPNRPLAACGPARCELALRGGDREAEGRGGDSKAGVSVCVFRLPGRCQTL